MWWIIGILAVVVLIVLWAISVYNKLVSAREFVRNSMGNIAAQIESRWDAVKSLIDAAKKYSTHEAEVLTNITAMRGKVDRTSAPADVEKDDNLFQQAMGQIDVVVENYPDLKADGVYIQAMQGIDRYENNVRQARMVYNDTVTKLNRMVQQFPSSIVAGMFGFNQEAYFESSREKAEMPQW
ncbi:MAG: LemA family protein [Eubacteriales bacterium]|nr:LemA family protein [Eubacteriales bacterium]MDD4324133.1 LemA family protein [Eubacteriales bacterium]MDD4541146.1 LemA family protein [Eubacteriales bacterium]